MGAPGPSAIGETMHQHLVKVTRATRKLQDATFDLLALLADWESQTPSSAVRQAQVRLRKVDVAHHEFEVIADDLGRTLNTIAAEIWAKKEA